MTDIASMEEDLANLRGQVILGLNPILGFGLFGADTIQTESTIQ